MTDQTGPPPVKDYSDWTEDEIAAASQWASTLPGHGNDNAFAAPYPGQSVNPYGMHNPYAVTVQPTNPYRAGPYAMPRKTPGTSIAGLVLGLVSWTICPVITALVGIFLSAAGLMSTSREPDLYDGKAIAIVGLVLNSLNVLAFALLFVPLVLLAV